MDTNLTLVLVAGVLALLYGAWTIRSVLSLSAPATRACRRSPRQFRKARRPT
jgi:hypothetical protein